MLSTPRSFSVPSDSKARSGLRRPSRQKVSPPLLSISPWDFAALPPAIRRKHFSPEEQYLIASQLNPVILDATDEALYKQYQRHQGRAESRGSYLLEHAAETDVSPDNKASIEEREEEEEEEEEWEDMETQDLESLKWLDGGSDLDLKLDDYHAISSDINTNQPRNARRRSYRRGLSFSNVSFRRRSSSPTSISSPPAGGSNVNKSTSLPAHGPVLPTHRSKDSTASLDPSATHYQDPAAKMKLRVYLASPQKFDEALEFGFPSLHQDVLHPPNRPRTSPEIVDDQPKTFFSDDTPSLSEDEGRDEPSDYLHQESPRTPIDMTFPGGRMSHKSSTDRSSHFRSRIARDTAESCAYASAADREMTLRMTLTRPELRAIEDADRHLGPSQINQRPLERAPLTAPVNNTGSIWDELPEEPSRVKRFIQKLKKKS